MSTSGEQEQSGDEAELRISDSDREQIASVLSEHAAAGRLTTDELDQRVGALYAAMTRGQARAVMTGLPALAPPELHHHLWPHHEHDEVQPILPDWFRTDEPDLPPSPPSGATTVAPPPPGDAGEPVPTDNVMQAAYDAWREARAKAKAGRRAAKRAEAAGDKEAAFRQFSESVRLTAAERSRRAKFNDLQKRRPDWTGITQ